MTKTITKHGELDATILNMFETNFMKVHLETFQINEGVPGSFEVCS